MASYKDLITAVRSGDVEVVDMTRKEAREFMDQIEHDGLLEAIDNAQGDAETEGEFTFVILKIAGGEL